MDLTRLAHLFLFLELQPDITACVRNLKLNGVHHNWDVTPCSLHTLHVVLGRMPRLETVSLKYLSITDDGLTCMTKLGLQSPLGHKLRCLSINCCSSSDGDISHILYLLCMFSDIEHLSISLIDNSYLKKPWLKNSFLPTLSQHAPIVRGLTLDGLGAFAISPILDFVRRSPFGSRYMKSIDLDIDTLIETSKVSTFLLEDQPPIESFTLRVFYESDINVMGGFPF